MADTYCWPAGNTWHWTSILPPINLLGVDLGQKRHNMKLVLTCWNEGRKTKRGEIFGYLVVVSTEIFKMSKADVRKADDDRDDQNYECEHGRCSRKP